jgi:UDP-GlcNAc:undecaprenyl-phosphate GlcNAc-1-phosphate transferase
MREYLVTLLIAAALCYLITPLVRKYALKFGAVAQVRSRDAHTTPTARWGGVAMWLAMTFTFLIVNHFSLVGKSFGREAQGIFLAATFIVLLGMADDRFELDSLTKLAGQALAAGILLLYGVQVLWIPAREVITLPASIGQFLTVLIVLVTINAVNFIDGLDGLAAGIVAVSAAAFFAFSYLLAVVYGFSRAGAPSLMTAVIIGICIGFLPHNWHPARIFMGDSGSMLLGLVLAASAVTLTGQIDPNAISEAKLGPTLLPLFLPFAVLAIPLLDLVLAVIRRIAKGKSPFSPDKEHLHHRLMSAGKTQQRTAVIMYLATATIAFPVTIAAFEPIWVAALSAVVLLAITISVFRFKFEKVAIFNG